MLKNFKEYNLFENFNNSNANISFAQLFALSPSLRKLCSKGLKTNSNDIREIKSIKNIGSEEDLNSILDNILNEIKEENLNELSVKDLHLKMYIPYTFNYVATIIT